MPEMMKKKSKSLIHPLALVESRLVGKGTRVWAYAHVMKGARLGAECNVGEHVFLEGGAVVGDRVTLKNGAMLWRGVAVDHDVFVGPGVLFTNDLYPRSPRAPWVRRRYSGTAWCQKTRVRHGASLGAGAVILPGVTIGRFAMVGAGAVVTRNVPDYALVIGNPAHLSGWVSPAGAKLVFGDNLLAVCRITRTHWRLGPKGIHRVVAYKRQRG